MMQDELGVHDRPPTVRVRTWLAAMCASGVIELTAAAVLAVWGALMVSPWAVFGSTSAYAAFRLLGMSETAWGLVFLAVALGLSGGLALGRPRLRIAGLVGATGLFAFTGTMFVVGNPTGFGWAGNFGYVVLCLAALRRLAW